MASTAYLQQAYLAYFGRPADVSGLSFYASKTEAQVVAAFSASSESQAFFGSLNTLAQINTIYQNLFNRAAEPAGLVYWAAEINAGRLSLAQASMGILAGAQNDDKLAVTNKLAAATAFTAALDTSAEMIGYQGSAVISSARAFLASVGSTAASLTAATATAALSASVATVVAAGTSSASAGSTFTLTTDDAGDSTGSTGDDKFIALEDALTQYVVDGGDGEDTLVATISASDTYDVSNIEAITFKVTAAATIDMDDFSDETSVTVKSSGDATLENFDASVALTSEQTGTADLTVTLDDASGSSDSLDLTLDDATTTGDYVLDDIETIALTSSGSENVIALDADSVTTLDISGEADIEVTLDINTASLETIDASAATGDVTIDATALALDLDVTTGSGDDTLEMALLLSAEDVIDMGDGEDTLEVDGSATIIDAETDITNVETLSITSVGTDVLDASNVVFDNIVWDSTEDADDFTVSGLTTESVTLTSSTGEDADDITVELDDATGEDDTVTITIESDDAETNFTIDDILTAEGGIETLALVLSGDVQVDGIDAEFATIEISGEAVAVIGEGASIESATIDASDATGDLTIFLGAAEHDITGGSGDDTFTFDTDALTSDDTIDGGDGEDTLETNLLDGGSAAPTVTGVETISVGFDEGVGSTFSGLNLSDDVVAIELDAETDGDVILTKLSDSVASIRLGSSATAAANDDATITYVSTADADHTITIGDSEGEDVDMEDVTINNNAGALTLVSDGEVANDIDSFAADDAASLAFTISNGLTVATTFSTSSADTVSVVTDGGALVITGAQDFSAATELTFSAADGNITFTGAMEGTDVTSLTVTAEADDFLQTGIFTSAAEDVEVSLTADGDGTITYVTLDVAALATLDMVATDGGDVTVSNIVMTGENAEGSIDVEITLDATGEGSTVTLSDFDSVAATTLDLVTIISDAEGTVVFTSGDTNLTITEIDASESLGTLTLDTSDLAAATTITFGDGTNDITTDLGFADDITLAAEGGTDTINIMDDQTAADTITNFVAGEDGDVISIDVSAILSALSNMGGTALDDTLSVKISSDDDGVLVNANNTVTASTNILRLTDSFSNVAAVVAAIDLDDEANVALANGDDILVLWTDGSDTFLSALNATALGATATASNTLVQLVGVDITDITAANFAFV